MASMSSTSGSASRRVNLRSTAVKRIMQEASELADPHTDDFVAAPLESDIFEWHCTVRGVNGSEFEGGLYHLRIVLPSSYPMSAPDILLLTPNGRFETGKKICIDGLTSFHAGSWQPAWGVRTAITGLRSFWMQGGEALSAIGALDYPKDERRRLAKLSRDWVCPACGVANHTLLPDPIAGKSTSVEASNDHPQESEAKDVRHVGEEEKPATVESTLPTVPDDAQAPNVLPLAVDLPSSSSTIPGSAIITTATAVPASTTTRTVTRSGPPRWLDALLVLLVATLLSILASKV